LIGLNSQIGCGKCQRLMDRDENAALNIVKRGLRFSPRGLVGEAVKGNENEATPILRADQASYPINRRGNRTIEPSLRLL
jgi:transposase